MLGRVAGGRASCLGAPGAFFDIKVGFWVPDLRSGGWMVAPLGGGCGAMRGSIRFVVRPHPNLLPLGEGTAAGQATRCEWLGSRRLAWPASRRVKPVFKNHFRWQVKGWQPGRPANPNKPVASTSAKVSEDRGESGVAACSAGFATAVQNAVVAGGYPEVDRTPLRKSLRFMGR